MFHSIISDYDVFFAAGSFDPLFPGIRENTDVDLNKDKTRKPTDFFSTDPKDYLKLV